MNMLTSILSNFNGKNKQHRNKDNRSSYILYKIVDQIPDNLFVLQCINTKATFYSHLSEIIFDITILFSLHPIQACYIGVEYAKSIKHLEPSLNRNSAFDKKINKQSVNRYGKYILLFQNRNKNICFLDKSNNEKFLMDPVDIAHSQHLIQEFDAAQAFHIGLLAGLKKNCVTKKINVPHKIYLPKLKLIVNNKINACQQI